MNATTCEETVKQQFETQTTSIQQTVAAITAKLRVKVDQLKALRPHLEDARAAEARLARHIAELSEQCALLPETLSDLHRLRDAIHALDTCPDLEAPTFHIPTLVGHWLQTDQRPTMSDAALDTEMNKKCQEAFGEEAHPARAAEVGEIEAMSIERLPLRNSAPVPLIGACPMCAGDSDEDTGITHADGHARVCWDTGEFLDRASARNSCSHGSRAFFCVAMLTPPREQALSAMSF